MTNSIVLSFDVGVVNLAYCLLTKNNDNWDILEWDIINLSDNEDYLCHCLKKATYTNIINNQDYYYCKVHSKNLVINEDKFEDIFDKLDYKDICIKCKKNGMYNEKNTNNKYCLTHSKQLLNNINKSKKLNTIKKKNSNKLNFDDVKFKLMMILEEKKSLLKADYVVIENQPSFKNPRMKSIASTLYDYYLIRGIIDKKITNSNISIVKFLSPLNKLKIINEDDNNELNNVNENKKYKLIKNLGIKYCVDYLKHDNKWLEFLNNHKKKDDLCDSFLQGLYYYDLKKK
jgi:hypothetical protein